MSSRLIVIGDVHGCVEELAELDRTLKINSKDHVVFVGDLVDKGPYSHLVLAYIMHLRKEGIRIDLVEGNHEDKHRRFRGHQEVFERTGKKNPMLGASWLKEINDKFKVEELSFLESAVLWRRFSERNLLIVHGGVPSWMKRLPHPVKWRNGKKNRRDRAAAMLRLRYEDKFGNMVGLGDEKPRDKFWAEKYDGRFGLVLFGHEACWKPAKPKEFKHAIGIDTGCCYGGALTAAVFEPGVEEPQFVSVKARDEYCSPTELRGSRLPGPNYDRFDDRRIRVIDRTSLSTGTPYRPTSRRHKIWFGDY